MAALWRSLWFYRRGLLLPHRRWGGCYRFHAFSPCQSHGKAERIRYVPQWSSGDGTVLHRRRAAPALRRDGCVPPRRAGSAARAELLSRHHRRVDRFALSVSCSARLAGRRGGDCNLVWIARAAILSGRGQHKFRQGDALLCRNPYHARHAIGRCPRRVKGTIPVSNRREAGE